jgi:hypothetical protein
LDTKVVQVNFPPTESGPSVVWDLDLSYVTAPVAGAAPYGGPIARTGYTGTISWEPAHNPFAALTSYTATLNLSTEADFVFPPEPAFVYHGGTLASPPELSGLTEGQAQVKLYFAPAEEANRPVDDFDLTGVIPVPAGGNIPLAAPVYREQYDISGITWMPAHSTFMEGTVYRATLTLSAKGRYVFAGVAANSFWHSGFGVVVSSQEGTEANTLEVYLSFLATETAIITKDLDLSYIGPPVNGEAPSVTGAFDKEEYTGIIQWNPADNPFLGWKSYTATVTLLAKSGYSFAGAAACTYSGGPAALSQTTVGTNRVVTISFPAGEKIPITEIDLTDYVSAPLAEMAPLTAAFSAADQHFSGGTVNWTDTAGAPAGGAFVTGQSYRARVTLTAAAGYTFDTDNLIPSHALGEGDITWTPAGGQSGTLTVTIPFPETGTAGILTLTGVQAGKTYAAAVFRAASVPDYEAFVEINKEWLRAAYREETVTAVSADAVRQIALRTSNSVSFTETGAFLVTITVSDSLTGDLEDVYYREQVPFTQGNAAFDLEDAGTFSRNNDLLGGALTFVEALRFIQDSPPDTPLEIILTPEPEIVGGNHPASLFTISSRGPITIKGGGKKVGTIRSADLLTLGQDAELILEDITLEGNDFTPLVLSGGKATLGAGAVITGSRASGARVLQDGLLTMLEGARIWNCTAPTRGGGVYVERGTFTMKGGEITGNAVTNSEIYEYDDWTPGHWSGGGGVFVFHGGKLIMEGGRIANNSAPGGGGVLATTYYTGYGTAEIIMEGGEISGNEAFATQYQIGGGGVWLEGAKLTMSGSAAITGNRATTGGGGVGSYAASGALVMKGPGNPRISGNTTYRAGGGVWLVGVLDMEAGEISGNHARLPEGVAYDPGAYPGRGTGGGVYMYNSGRVSMSGTAVIKDNTADALGGGLFMHFANYNESTVARLIMSGPDTRITGNHAEDGGGVFAGWLSSYSSQATQKPSLTFEDGAVKETAITGNTVNDCVQGEFGG